MSSNEEIENVQDLNKQGTKKSDNKNEKKRENGKEKEESQNTENDEEKTEKETKSNLKTKKIEENKEKNNDISKMEKMNNVKKKDADIKKKHVSFNLTTEERQFKVLEDENLIDGKQEVSNIGEYENKILIKEIKRKEKNEDFSGKNNYLHYLLLKFKT
jgi:hypothetical protein